jgi:hypothetical protein
VSNLYCVIDNVRDVIGDTAVNLRLAANPGAMGSAIDWASGVIDEFCLPAYGDQLLASRWVRNAATSLACVKFCTGTNPPPDGVLLEYDRLMGADGVNGVLKKIQRSQQHIPDIPRLLSGAPRMTNTHIREFPVPHPVKEPARSTDGITPGTVRQDNYDPLRFTPDW